MYYDRQYKSTVFALLYEDRNNLMDLYNGLYDEKCTEPEAITVNTLKDEDGVQSGIFMKFRNDLSFIFDSHLHLYEHQSSVSDNIPLRMLIYITMLIKKLVKTKDLYKAKGIDIPSPRFVVFYNGTKDMPVKTELRLSDLYMVKDPEPELELKVTLYNINTDKDSAPLEKSRTLREYMQFVDMAREALEGKTSEEEKRSALSNVIDRCIEEEILADFLREHREEIIMTCILQYDQEAHETALYEEGREDERANTLAEAERANRAEQRADEAEKRVRELESILQYDKEAHETALYEEGHDAGYVTGCGEGDVRRLIILIGKKRSKGKSHSVIADEIEENVSFVEEICSIAEKVSPEFDEKKIATEYLRRHRTENTLGGKEAGED